MFKKAAKKTPVTIETGPTLTDEPSVLPQVPKKRPRGLETQLLAPVKTKAEEFPLIHKVFVKSSEKIEALQNRHMEEYIKERLAHPENDPALAHICQKISETSEEDTTLFSVPEKFQTDESIYQDAAEKTNWLSGLAEVPLTIEHKLDNIEQTENSKRLALKTGGPIASRFDDIHYEEVEAFHSRRLKTKVEEQVWTQLEKQFKLTRRDRKTSEELRSAQNRRIEKDARL